MNYERYEVTTKFGMIKIKPTQGDHIFVDLNGLTMRGIGYKGNMHVYRWSAGTWQIGPESKNSYERRQHFYLTRDWATNNFNASPPSESARKAIEAEVLPLIQKWIAANADALTHADRERRADEVRKRMEQIRELNKEIEKLGLEIIAFQAPDKNEVNA
jgi:hypothetical protein